MKISATEPSSALRNAAEIENVLVQRYGRRGLVPPILIIYTGGGPEHRTTYLSVNITMIALQKSLNLDVLLTVRTAPGSSYRNPSKRDNCILNLGLYGIGVMRQKIFDKTRFSRDEKKFIQELGIDISKLWGQGYDGASVTIGVYGVVQRLIIDMCTSLVPFVHCASHNLNLVTNDAVSSIPRNEKFFTILQELFTFFGSSLNRCRELQIEADQDSLTLKKLYSA